jgi:hypothetical protein
MFAAQVFRSPVWYSQNSENFRNQGIFVTTQTLKNQESLDGIDLQGTTRLILEDCSSNCLSQIPPHITSVVYADRSVTADSNNNQAIEFPSDTVTEFELTMPKDRRISISRWPTSLRKLQLTGSFDLSLIPKTIVELSLWNCTFSMPLTLELPILQSLMVYESSMPLVIEELPSSLKSLSIWRSVVHTLPSRFPELQSLTFRYNDMKSISWSALPCSLEILSVHSCELPIPIQLEHLIHVKNLQVISSGITEIRNLLALPQLKNMNVVGNPLSEDSLSAIATRRKEIFVSRSPQADLELTRLFYQQGINLEVQSKGKKKVRLHSPMGSMYSDLDRSVVETLMAKQQSSSPKLVGQAFIDQVRDEMLAEKKRKAEERKAARKAKKLAAENGSAK